MTAVDRSKAALLGLSETEIASDLLISLSGSSQTTLSFWIDPKSGSQYNVVAQTPRVKREVEGSVGRPQPGEPARPAERALRRRGAERVGRA